ncbi:hypothetical protein [Nostoc favosum]|nr:hypothetical protein [Nostoc favosum]
MAEAYLAELNAITVDCVQRENKHSSLIGAAILSFNFGHFIL